MARLTKLLLVIIALWGLNWLIRQFAADTYAYELQIVNLIGINIIMAVSLNLINGITGQFSIGHAGFMAIGAYVSAAMTYYGDPWLATHLHFLPTTVRETAWFLCALGAGGLVAAGVGWCVGMPSLRLRGDYLAMATLGFGEIIRVVILNLEVVGGARGFPGIAERADFFWIYLIVCCTVWIVWHLVRTPKGQAFYAVREDEIATAAIGISTTRYKVTAFVVGAFFAGVGGGLFAHYLTYLHTNSFTFIRSFEFVAMVVLGGLGSFTGSILAATLLTALPELLRGINEYRMILYSLLLIVFMLVRREGLLGRREFSWRWLARRRTAPGTGATESQGS